MRIASLFSTRSSDGTAATARPIGWIFAFEDGKIREFWTFSDQAQALRVTGPG